MQQFQDAISAFIIDPESQIRDDVTVDPIFYRLPGVAILQNFPADVTIEFVQRRHVIFSQL